MITSPNRRIVKKFVTKPFATGAIIFIVMLGCFATATVNGNVKMIDVLTVAVILTFKGAILTAFYNSMFKRAANT